MALPFQNPVLILIAVLVIMVLLILVVAWRNGYKKQIAQMLFYLVMQAETEFGGGTGDVKFAAVTTWLYSRIPPYVRFFISTKQISMMIEEAVVAMKGYLEQNINTEGLKPPDLPVSQE